MFVFLQLYLLRANKNKYISFTFLAAYFRMERFNKFRTIGYIYTALGLSITGSALYGLSVLFAYARWEIARKFYSSLILRSEETTAFEAVFSYITKYCLKDSLRSGNLYGNSLAGTSPYLASLESYESKIDDFKYTPAEGNYRFTYNGRIIFMSFSKSTKENMNWYKTDRHITLYSRGSLSFLKDFVKYAVTAIDKEDEDTITVSIMTAPGRSKITKQRKRDPGTLVLKDGLLDSIFRDTQNFFKEKEFYRDRGIPYRRGYLFSGPPGCGKSSIIKCMASHFGLAIRLISISSPSLDDASLLSEFADIGPRTIVVLEDVDCIFTGQEKKKEKVPKLSAAVKRLCDERGIRDTNESITMAGLLNALDGISSSENYILVMTTNYPERLDEALVRPGRVDRNFVIDMPERIECSEMFSKFYPKCDMKGKEAFLSSIDDYIGNVSMATLQGHFLMYKHDPVEAIENAHKLAPKFTLK